MAAEKGDAKVVQKYLLAGGDKDHKDEVGVVCVSCGLKVP